MAKVTEDSNPEYRHSYSLAGFSHVYFPSVIFHNSKYEVDKPLIALLYKKSLSFQWRKSGLRIL